METFLGYFSDMGLVGIFILMALESSLVPVPSEIVMIPAGMLVARGEYSAVAAIVVGGLGSVLGAWINYFIGWKFGKSFIDRFGKYICINTADYDRAEKFFLKGAKLYTFIGRLLPVIRHLISIPAGIFRMSPIAFSTITFIGASLWCGVLVGVGYYLGEPAIKLMQHYLLEVKIAVIVIGSIGVGMFFYKKTCTRTPLTNKSSR